MSDTACHVAPSPDPAIVRIAMIQLRNDDNGSYSQDTRDELRALYGEARGANFEVLWVPCVLGTESGAASDIAEAGETAAETIARISRSDVVIWGFAAQRRNDPSLRLTHDRGIEGKDYAFDDLTFDELLPNDRAALIVAKLTGLVNWAPEEAGGWMVPLMQALLPTTRRLTVDPPPGLSNAQRTVDNAHMRCYIALTLDNLEAVLRAADMGLGDVIRLGTPGLMFEIEATAAA